MSIRAAEAGLRIYEVPSHERLRQHGASNLSAIRDGWRILRLIAAEKRAIWRRNGAKRAANDARRPSPSRSWRPGTWPTTSALRRRCRQRSR